MEREKKSGKTIAILGPGGIGGFLAALFCRAGLKVSCIYASKEEAEKARETGLALESDKFGIIKSFPETCDFLNFEPDYLFVTVKAPFLKSALEKIRPENTRNSIVIPLLNGCEHIQIIRDYLGPCVAVGMIGGIEAKKISGNGVSANALNAHIKIASKDISDSALQGLLLLLNEAGIPTEIMENEEAVVWQKLARLNAIACATAATNMPISYARQNKEWREKIKECVREAVAVAKTQNVVNLDAEKIISEIDRVPEGQTTSMQRDLVAGNESELDAIPGAILRLGKKNGIPCPAIEYFLNCIKEKYGR
ncbi:MAG: 2-dehydropantoate 2-reductase [Patescibacteria group bacterium]